VETTTTTIRWIWYDVDPMSTGTELVQAVGRRLMGTAMRPSGLWLMPDSRSSSTLFDHPRLASRERYHLMIVLESAFVKQ